MINLDVKKKAVYAIIPVLMVACKPKPVDPVVQAKIDKVEAQKKAATDSMNVASDLSHKFNEKRDSLNDASRKMYFDAYNAARNRVMSKYTLNKLFKPEQVAAIKQAVQIRGNSSFIATAYENIMSGKGTLIDVTKVMSEISNADKVAKMETAAKGVLGFDKDDEGYFAVFVDNKIHAMAVKEAEELSALSKNEFAVPEMAKIEKTYKANGVMAERFDSIGRAYADAAKRHSWRVDSLANVLQGIVR